MAQKCFLMVLLFFGIYTLKAQVYSLEQCIDIAIKNNFQLKQEILKSDYKEQELQFQKNVQKPVLSSQINNGLSSGFQQVFSGNFVGEYKSVQSYANQGSLDFSMNIWNKNAQQIKIESEKINVKIAQLAIENQKFSLSLEVMAKFYNVLIAKERLKIAEQIYTNRKNQFEKEERLYKVGQISLSKLNNNKVYLIQDQQNLQNEKNNYDRSKLELAIILQISHKNELEVLDEAPNSTFETINFEKQSKRDFRNFPRIKLEEEKLKYTENEVKFLKTRYYPKMGFNYRIGTSAQQVFEFPNLTFPEQYRNNLFQTASLSLNIPIYSQGNNNVRLQQAKINQQIQLVVIDEQKTLINNEIETILFEIKSNHKMYLLAVENEEQSKLQYDFNLKNYELGKINLYELNISRDNYVLAGLKKIQSKYEVLFKQKQLALYPLN